MSLVNNLNYNYQDNLFDKEQNLNILNNFLLVENSNLNTFDFLNEFNKIENNLNMNLNFDEKNINENKLIATDINKIDNYLNNNLTVKSENRCLAIKSKNLQLNILDSNKNLNNKNLSSDNNILEITNSYNLQNNKDNENIIKIKNLYFLDSKEFSNKLIEKIENLGKTIDFQRNFDVKTAKIRLDPPQLGSIEIIIQQNNKGLNIQLQANNNEVLKQLNNLTENLKNDLQNKNNNEVLVKINQQNFNQNFENSNKKQQQNLNQENREEKINNSLLDFNS